MSIVDAEGLNNSSSTESIANTVESLIEIVEDQQQQINDLQDELQSTKKEAAQDRQRITETETRLDAVKDDESPTQTHTVEDETNGSTTEPTPLEQVCAMPEQSVVSQLTANQRRARFVARDIEQYASKVPAGYSITSGEISTVLRAGTECDGRTQTVARVIDFLDRLGDDAVKIVKRRGTKRVVLSEEIVSRLTGIEDDNNGRRYPTVGMEAL